MAATALLGGDVTNVRFRLSRDSYFKTTLRYRVKDENGSYQWSDFPVGAAVEIHFPHPDGITADFVYSADSILTQYAKFLIDPADVNDVLDAACTRGQIWFDDGTGLELVASGVIVVED